ncbi:carboxypeptidase-like regulatory domain-containing protein [Vibrio owensii]|uniref:carboxypeptidase-like regulatory domain-containing protein n=1 Tax=Vibrio owensii TaxID=696485 RepID=UPI00339AE128
MRLTKVGLAVLTALLASGCSDDDSTSSASPPAKLNFSIQGIATDAPIANALITAKIGDRTVTTTANETGNYSLDFEYDEGSLAGTEMVEVTAKGEGQQSHIELIGQLGSFNMLLEQAGDDNTLQQEESSRTAITQISTAMHFLSQQSGQELSTDEALVAAESQVDVEELLEISAIIKVLADNPDYTPEEESSILDILSSSEEGVEKALEEYFANNQLLDESGELIPEFSKAIEEAKQQTIDDPLVTPSFDALGLAGTYLLHSSVANGWVARYGEVIRIDDENQAWLSDSQTPYQLSSDKDSHWNLTPTGKLYISTLNSSESVSVMSGEDIVQLFGDEAKEVLPSLDTWLEVKQTLRGITLTKLTKGTESKVATTFTYQHILDVPGSASLTATTEVDSTAVLSKTNNESEIWKEAPSGTWALPIIADMKGVYDEQAQDYLVHQQVTLEDNSTVLGSGGDNLGTWHFESGELSIKASEGWEVTYLPHRSEEGLISALVTVSVDSKEQSTINWLAPFSQEESTLKDDFLQEMPYVLGAWVNSWKASESNVGLPNINTVYGYTFTQSGEASWTWTSYDEEDNPYFITEYTSFQQWASPEEHQYVLKGTSDMYGYMRERERTWTTISTLENGRHLVLEQSNMRQGYTDDQESFEEGYWIFPRINVLKPIDLSTYAEAYQRSKDKGSILE